MPDFIIYRHYFGFCRCENKNKKFRKVRKKPHAKRKGRRPVSVPRERRLWYTYSMNKIYTLTKFNSFEALLSDFEKNAPERPAVVFESGGKPCFLSRSGFASMAREKARELSASGKKCPGIVCDGSLPCLVAIFASALAGLQTVLLDENASEELLRGQIMQTDIDMLLCSDEDLLGELESALTRGPGTVSGERDILFFTSGTTSSSKAVVLTDKSLMAAAFSGSSMLPLSEEDILMCMLPLNHVFGLVCGVLWGMQCGAPVALGRGTRYYAQDLSFYRPTVLSAVPLLLSFLLQHRLKNSELRLVLVGAGACPPSLLEAAAQQKLAVSFGYGLTETSSGVAISVPGTPDFDPFAMEICPEDTVSLAEDGEILVRSESCMMKGYYGHPEDTEKVMKEGVLYTGDLGRWDEKGRLRIIGRKKEILVLRDGTKIFLPEYEARIGAALPGEDFTVLEKDGRPVLVLHDKEAAQASESHMAKARSLIQLRLKEVMAALPRGQQLGGILFTALPLPRTATGKVRRWEINI